MNPNEQNTAGIEAGLLSIAEAIKGAAAPEAYKSGNYFGAVSTFVPVAVGVAVSVFVPAGKSVAVTFGCMFANANTGEKDLALWKDGATIGTGVQAYSVTPVGSAVPLAGDFDDVTPTQGVHTYSLMAVVGANLGSVDYRTCWVRARVY